MAKKCKGCDASNELAQVMAVLQRFQPPGSPPPGGPVRLATWILADLRAQAEQRYAQPAPTRPRCVQCGGLQMHHCDMDEPSVDHAASCTLYHHEFQSPAPEPPEVAGDVLPVSLAEHERRLRFLIGEVQQSANPDTAIIGALCDSVRLAREHAKLAALTPVATPKHGCMYVESIAIAPESQKSEALDRVRMACSNPACEAADDEWFCNEERAKAYDSQQAVCCVCGSRAIRADTVKPCPDCGQVRHDWESPAPKPHGRPYLCDKCEGNGVVPIYSSGGARIGVSECVQCSGRGELL